MKSQPRYHSGDRIANRYRVHQALLGGMGEVYLCLDLEENYPYALKTFQQRYLTDHQRLRRAFEQEVATWVALERHPNIVHCYIMEILDNQPFMKLEWINGEAGRGTDLRGWLRHGSLGLRLALEIAIDICCGLTHAQAKSPGLVHRDLKPENILMAQGGLAKITDFGLAQIVQTAALQVIQESATTGSRQSFIGKQDIVGTPAYMAPEQWRGEPVDERTDIYALGIMLYEMLTGVCPFQVDFPATTPQSFQTWLNTLQSLHENGVVATLPTAFPIVLNDLLQRCLAKVQSKRPANLSDLAEQLIKIYGNHIGGALPIRPEPMAFTAEDYTNRGVTYHTLGRYEAALADYNCALELNPNLAIAYSNRGNTYQELGQHNAALTDFNRAISLDPYYAEAYYNRGITYKALGQYEAALADYTHTLQINPNFAQAYANRASIYQLYKRREDTLADLNIALTLDPNLATVYVNRGLLYAELGQQETALTDYARAIALDPTDAQAYYNRGVTLLILKRYEAALADYNRAIELDPNYAKAYCNRGTAHWMLGLYPQALADYGQAIELNAGYADAYFAMGFLLVKLDQPREALFYLEKATQLGHSRAAQTLEQVNQQLAHEPPVEVDPMQLAFEAFQQADSPDAMKQAVAHFPLLVQSDFINLLAQIVAEQITRAERPAFEQRLTWLRQIATNPKPGFFSQLFNRGER